MSFLTVAPVSIEFFNDDENENPPFSVPDDTAEYDLDDRTGLYPGEEHEVHCTASL